MLAIPYPTGSTFEYKKRIIIEVINENSIIVDSPFPIHKDLPEQIFDFKLIAQAAKQNDTMTI